METKTTKKEFKIIEKYVNKLKNTYLRSITTKDEIFNFCFNVLNKNINIVKK